jgi:hypothetical protein
MALLAMLPTFCVIPLPHRLQHQHATWFEPGNAQRVHGSEPPLAPPLRILRADVWL